MRVTAPLSALFLIVVMLLSGCAAPQEGDFGDILAAGTYDGIIEEIEEDNGKNHIEIDVPQGADIFDLDFAYSSATKFVARGEAVEVADLRRNQRVRATVEARDGKLVGVQLEVLD
jgi:uncharacterized protein YceK